jgi:phenylalanyl-tRNA synthetase beta chain
VPLLRVANPLSEDQSVMRPLLLPGLLDAARHNAARGRPGLALFESAHVYRVSGPLDQAPEGSPRGATPAHERHHVGALMTQALPRTWRCPERPADFFGAKGVLEAMLATVGVSARFGADERPFLHPGRTATVFVGDDERNVGWIGELHPSVAAEWDLDAAAAFEIDFDLLAEIAPGPAAYRDVTTFPPLVQDIAVMVPEEVMAAEVEAAVREGAGPLLDRIELFDVYRGEPVLPGRKSLAMRLEFRAADRTLTDDDVAVARAGIENALEGVPGSLRRA